MIDPRLVGLILGLIIGLEVGILLGYFWLGGKH